MRPARLGWAGCTDDVLLARMQQMGYPVLVTMDRGLRWARPRSAGAVGVVLMHARTNQLVDVVELLPDVVSAVRRVRAGQVVVVDQQERRR